MAREFGTVVGYFVNIKQDGIRKFFSTKKEVQEFLEPVNNQKKKLFLVVQYNGGNLSFQKTYIDSIDSFPINRELICDVIGRHKSDWRIPIKAEHRHQHHLSET